ncbi:hypothetical protein ACFLXI_02020 [Chloroflexota bacterium]
MGKYDRFDQYQEMKQSSSSQIHPIWAGIGCVLLILIPVMAFAAADTFFDTASGSGLSLYGSTILPGSGILYHVYFSFPLWGDTVLRFSLFHLVFVIFFSVVGFLVFSLVYAIVYRFTGPPKYGPTDAPPPRKIKKRR